jgi:hypothetical protein
VGVDGLEVAEGGAGVGEEVLAAGIGGADALEELIAGRVLEEWLVGVEADRCVGVAELVGVLVGGVVGAEIFDAAEVGADDAQAGGLEGGDEGLGGELGGGAVGGVVAEDGGAVLADAVEGGVDLLGEGEAVGVDDEGWRGARRAGERRGG